jgi:predicted HTH transcriptional regulator
MIQRPAIEPSNEKLMIDLPRTIADLEKLIRDQVQESVHLDYKQSEALSVQRKPTEIVKDVSSFANSDGGVLIYGIVEKDHLPVRIDDGSDHADITRERIEQLLLSNIQPRVAFEVAQIPLSADRSVFAVRVLRSTRVHQNSVDKKYYKRFNFLAQPMEDYETEWHHGPSS